MDREVVTQLIIDHEGKRYRAYLDTEGIPTVGVGMKLMDPGQDESGAPILLPNASAKSRMDALNVSYVDVCAGNCELDEGQIYVLFSYDLHNAIADAAAIVDGFWNLPDDVQHALIDLSFNVGGPRFAEFKKMIAYLEAKPPDLRHAAAEMLDSKWARQVPNRAQDDVNLILRHS